MNTTHQEREPWAAECRRVDELTRELAQLRANLERLAARWGARSTKVYTSESCAMGESDGLDWCEGEARRVLAGETPPEPGQSWPACEHVHEWTDEPGVVRCRKCGEVSRAGPQHPPSPEITVEDVALYKKSMLKLCPECPNPEHCTDAGQCGLALVTPPAPVDPASLDVHAGGPQHDHEEAAPPPPRPASSGEFDALNPAGLRALPHTPANGGTLHPVSHCRSPRNGWRSPPLRGASAVLCVKADARRWATPTGRAGGSGRSLKRGMRWWWMG